VTCVTFFGSDFSPALTYHNSTLKYSHFTAKAHHKLQQGSATYGPQVGSSPPSKFIRPAAPLANCSNCMTCWVALNFMNLPSLQLLASNTY